MQDLYHDRDRQLKYVSDWGACVVYMCLCRVLENVYVR